MMAISLSFATREEREVTPPLEDTCPPPPAEKTGSVRRCWVAGLEAMAETKLSVVWYSSMCLQMSSTAKRNKVFSQHMKFNIMETQGHFYNVSTVSGPLCFNSHLLDANQMYGNWQHGCARYTHRSH